MSGGEAKRIAEARHKFVTEQAELAKELLVTSMFNGGGHTVTLCFDLAKRFLETRNKLRDEISAGDSECPKGF